MAPLNTTYNESNGSFLPEDFTIRGSTDCPSRAEVLWHLGLYNGVAIVSTVLFRNIYVQNILNCGRPTTLKPWRWFSAIISLLSQIAGQVATAYLARGSSTSVDPWQVIQLWALRPRTAWSTGNLAQLPRKWGYQNAALSSIFAEIFICSLSCVFVGRLIGIGVQRGLQEAPDLIAFSFIMMFATAFEILFALRIVIRIGMVGWRPEASDYDSLRWIARTAVPLTYICCWLIWALFLNKTAGAYCPANTRGIDAIWAAIIPGSDLLAAISERYFQNGTRDGDLCLFVTFNGVMGQY
jgi:hypothetical protein